MAQVVPQITEAISKVILHLIPRRAYEVLFALVPGLLFAIPIVLTNPVLACKFALRSQEGLGLNNYGRAGLVLLLTFAIGHAIMLWVVPIQRLFVFLCARARGSNEVPGQDRKLLAL